MITIEKPWGKEEIIETNQRYTVKRLTMWKNMRCSLQYHNLKCETIVVVSGVLRIIQGDSPKSLDAKDYHPGECVTLKPGVVHRMECAEDCVYLEASTSELNDVVRLEDDYNRA
ncbi:cupin [Desulfovibrio aerotolerans]|uniref:Cupin n=1 Tax=Solidesulfovibrio aerotolerans TaxID=295255 RepID=A0A7C9IML6_9BACT|nr:cupin [Solidesulfovibrio aerotolerans]MYL84661.1 cupin [Solidesulfovibrio aerotolerans]